MRSGEVSISGRAILGRRTKGIIRRLGPETIPVIDHENLDRITAETLVERGVRAVVNAARSSTGLYPNLGPAILARAGVYILDEVGGKVFERVKEGEEIEVRSDGVYRTGTLIAAGEHLDSDAIERDLLESQAQVGEALERFADNTMEFMRSERYILFSTLDVPAEIEREIRGRQVLVVVRGYDYREDLAALGPYLRGENPYVIGVDGGADAVIEAGRSPDLVFGDMDSVSPHALREARRILVHAYEGGDAPGLIRLREMGLKDAMVLAAPGLSEDIAILIAEQCGAELIVAVGTHVGLVEFLDKGRRGASSTFLMRLKVGSLLVDAKGVSKLYPSRASVGQLVAIVGAGLVTASAVVVSSPKVTDIFELLALKLRLMLGI